jgi:hypothetical protein
MLLDLWGWLGDLEQGQATVLGLIGGFFTLVAGALINASLNRKRDNQLRREDQRAMAVALKTELAGWNQQLEKFVEGNKSKGLSGFPLPTTRLLPDMIPKLGLLGSATIDRVIAAYDHVDYLAWALLWQGAEMERSDYLHSRWINVPSEKLSSAIEEIEATMTILKSAIAELDHYEPSLRRAWRWLRSTG